MEPRNPRIDPEHGDAVLASEGRLRAVVMVLGSTVHYRQMPHGNVRQSSIDTWREWCETNQVKAFPRFKEEP